MASAKKRVEHALAKQQRGGGSGTIQINTTVDDPQKSIDELINAGLRTHQERGQSKHFNKNIKYPPSFWRPQPKPRYASGHSRDSSDDGFGSLAGRHTLSPSSVSSFGPHGHAGTLPGPILTSASQSDILHKRQASAPALINYEQFEGHQQAPAFGGQPGFSGAAATTNSGSGQIHQQQMQQQQFHQQQQGPTNCNNNDAARGAGGGSLKNRSAGLPPLGHQPYHHAYSRSLNAVTASPPATAGAHHSVHSVGHQSQSSATPTTNPMFLSAIGAELPPAGNHHHRAAKSCDYDMMGGASGHPTASAGGQMAAHPMGTAPAQFGQQPAGFYGQQIQQAAFDNLIWPNQRAKSQSMDPLSFQQQSSTSRGGGGFRPDIDFPYPDLSSSHSIGSPPTDPSPQQMMSSPTALPFLNPQHQSSPQSAEPMILCVKEEDDPLGPMPDGWQKAVAPNGDPYFIDHTNKETTWYDPRIPKGMQEAQIMLRHTNQQQQMGGGGTRGPQHGYSQSVGGVANTRMGQIPAAGGGGANAFAVDSNFNQQGVSTAPNGPANPLAIGGLDRVQQLMQEKHQIQEKRDQIIRQGFLDSNYRQNQQPQFGGGGPSSQQIGGGTAPAGQFAHQHPTAAAAFLQPQRGTPTAAGGGIQSDLMEVDSASPFQHQSVTGYIDPIFKDYNFNPHEFEQYLNINENATSRSAAAAAVATTQPQQNMAQ